MKKFKKLLIFALPMLFAGFSMQSVHAADLMDRIAAQDMLDCFQNSIMNSTINTSNPDKNFVKNLTISEDKDSTVAITSGGYGNQIKDGDLACYELIGGYDEDYGVLGGGGVWNGVIPGAKTNHDTTDVDAAQTLRGLGYEPKNDEGSGKINCMQFVYQNDKGTPPILKTDQICVTNLTDKNTFGEDSVIQVHDASALDSHPLGTAWTEGYQQYVRFKANNKTVTIRCIANGGLSDCGKVKIKSGGAWDKFKNDVYDILAKKASSIQYYDLLRIESGGLEEPDGTGTDSSEWVFKDNNWERAVRIAIQTIDPSLVGADNNSDDDPDDDPSDEPINITFTKEERTNMNKWYFANYFKATLVCGDPTGLSPANSIELSKKNNGETCYAKFDDKNAVYEDGDLSKPKVAHCITRDLRWHEDLTLAQLAEEMTVEELQDAENAAEPETEQEPNDGDGADCASSGAAGALGWIVCPIMEWLSGAAQTVYTNFIEPVLKVEPELFRGDSATRDAWSNFRDIANVCFIIIFLVVIFSQLTGVGIDNYGVKKILPKLIVVAIMINLSYTICQVFIDLANILGNALLTMFRNLATGSPKGVDVSIARQVTSTTISGLAIAGAIVALVKTVGKDPSITLTLFIAIVGVVIAVLFLFLMLAARQAAIVVLTVLSPLAVICYALPNTKSIFDKWRKLFVDLLLVYPIASLLVGGGDFVSRLLLSSGFITSTESGNPSIIKAIIAMVVGIIPIFFIPTVLKNSLAALGNLGVKMSNMGRRVSGATTGAIRNSEKFKDMQTYAKEWGAARNANKTISRLRSRSTPLSARQEEKLRRAEDTVAAYEGRREENRQRAAASDYLQAVRNKQRLDTQEAVQNTSLYGDARFVEAQRNKQENARRAKMAEANVGVPLTDQEIFNQRQRSARQTQEIRNYQDQYAAYTPAQMNQELKDAAHSYDINRDEDSALRLAAILQVAESQGMDKEMFAELNDVQFQGDNANDAIVLSTLKNGQNVVLRQYAKARSHKNNSGHSASLQQFMDGTASSGRSDAHNDSLAEALESNGVDVLNGANDDTLEYIGNKNASAVSTETLLHAAAKATNKKELDQIHKMLRDRKAGDTEAPNSAANGNYKLSPAELGKLKYETWQNLDRSVYQDAVDTLMTGGEANQQILNQMDSRIREKILNPSSS